MLPIQRRIMICIKQGEKLLALLLLGVRCTTQMTPIIQKFQIGQPCPQDLRVFIILADILIGDEGPFDKEKGEGHWSYKQQPQRA